ncbi:hypothetical protein HPC49_37355 [Pyxidicoccus fallax]|uniref:Uncharacterized protein n=1 Tax=Pyxidicoccus fallax TaxID=394095 RepID=A0A848LN05_9BACT|nr:hypothetical protein [Pyxidicoccus fallax]NMO19050.1 hypothetical protein [Pyxidicoccus fallax]NPC83871.1 hypothetical protein [Pyxidicoccus fallax]
MSAVLAVLCLLVTLALSLAVLGFALTTLGFTSEAYHRGMTTLHIVITVVAVLVAATPLFVTVWAGWRRFFSSRPWEDVPLGLGLPLLAPVVCAGLSLLAFHLGERVASHQSQQRRAEELAALRAEVDGGALEKSCDIILTDPRATPEDMRRCRTRIESLSDPKKRWAELQRFLDIHSGFQTWTPMKVGLAPKWDWNRSVVVVRHDQEWFIRTFYETWLAQPEAFDSEKELTRLNGCLRDTDRWTGWTPSALAVFRAQVLPAIVQRVEAQRERHQELLVWPWLQKALAEHQAPPKKKEVPPVPKLDAVPERSIGLARFDADGTLHLWLRATPETGAFGDVYLTYTPSDEHYGPWKSHLDSTEPGKVQPVAALAD